jgi:mRNA interferase MazF
MKPRDVVLIRLPQTGTGTPKLRPALVLANLPGPYQTILLAGISTQLKDIEANWDETINPGDNDFKSSGLRQPPVIRLSYLYAADETEINGWIGTMDQTRTSRLRQRLSQYLRT